MIRLAAKVSAAGTAGAASALGLLTLTEAGVPIPVPGDVLMLLLGERAAAGTLPLWVAVFASEAVALAGLVFLFAVSRGPGAGLIRRVGGRVGLTQERLGRVQTTLEQRGRTALALGRATPGLRTITVVACAGTGTHARRALPALLLGSTVFVQGHVLLGFALGPVARDALERARLPVIALLVALALAGLVVMIRRRGRRAGAAAWAEATCPACLVANLAARSGH